MKLPYSSPKLTERLAVELRQRAADQGWVLAARCQWCGAPIFAPTSLAQRAGPTCRKRHKKDGPANDQEAGTATTTPSL